MTPPSMVPASILDIVTLCHDLDCRALQFYQSLAGVGHEPALAAFWARMAEDEQGHVAFWNEALFLAELGDLPQLFDQPDRVGDELRRLLEQTDPMTQACLQTPTPEHCFRTAFRLEFFMLHPAFETLFYFMVTQTGRNREAPDYPAHIARFLEALKQHGSASPELELMGEVLTRLWQENRLLARQSSEDELTGLLNRRGFFRAVKPVLHLAQRNGFTIGVIIADIDNFKRINDSHGHVHGDQVLAEVAARLQAACRASDILGRYGGEEFIILTAGQESGSLLYFAERLRTAVSDKSVKGHAITVSLGAACARFDREVDQALSDLIGDADSALLCAKEKGKNQTRLSSP